MIFAATKHAVYNRGVAPDAFLEELVEFGRTLPAEVYAPNAVPVDIFTVIKSSLATPISRDRLGATVYVWESLEQRRAALCEAMRVHAGLESSWKWGEGVDRTNRTSMANRRGEETGIFQVSFDSEGAGHGALQPFIAEHDIGSVGKFIPAMKSDHRLAMGYYARLVRVSIAWAGPLLRHGDDSVYPWLRRDAVAELQKLLAA